MTNTDMIRANLLGGIKAGYTHMLMVCDTFDYTDYPVFARSKQEAHVLYDKHNGLNMQRIMEVYNLALPIEDQLREQRAMHF